MYVNAVGTHTHVHMYCTTDIQCNLSIKPLCIEHLSVEDTVFSHNDIKLCSNLHLSLIPRPFSAILSF